MPRRTTSLPQLQEHIWDELPDKKLAVGREAVFDVVSALVQEWPDEQLSGLNPEDMAGSKAIADLHRSAKRHMRLVYGSAKFDSMWILALQILLPIIINQLLDWWKRRKDNRARLRRWRKRWINGDET
jgi:hypothetical protein